MYGCMYVCNVCNLCDICSVCNVLYCNVMYIFSVM